MSVNVETEWTRKPGMVKPRLDNASLNDLFTEIRRRYANGIELAKLQNVEVYCKRKASLEILDCSETMYMNTVGA